MQHTAGPFAEKGSHYIKKKVVIVDDSRTIRSWLRVVLEQDPRLQVVGEADSAAAARQVIKQTEPDVITLDIKMPGMNGLAFLEKLMTLRPMPVVMISGVTKSNSEATITALSLGAVDCILKPTSPADQAAHRDITRRVFSAACSKVRAIRRPVRGIDGPLRGAADGPMPIIVIGASTGGVAALERVLADLDVNAPPVVIVQHMPGAFLVSFSQMLNQNLQQDVALAREGEVLTYGQIRLAPAQGRHTQLIRRGDSWQCRYTDDDQGALHCPSVDVLFRSAVEFGRDVIAVILTGLGRDGADAMLKLREAGAITLGQDEQSSVVYGMPRVAYEIGAVQEQLALERIGAATNRAVSLHGQKKER
ncbi:MAG: chemotaxis-specific protein-glutamate methyltransferase CheB [Sulfitobacter sp.]|nr:chemotaxis-specific protein-glutamate methyltransferase CheB [Sulfitobacter sp.]